MADTTYRNNLFLRPSLLIYSETRALLSTDGLYRINGNCAEIQKLRFLVDSEKPVDLTDKRLVQSEVSGGGGGDSTTFFRHLQRVLTRF